MMMLPKDKGLHYWVPIILGLLTLFGIFARGSIRLSDTERKTAHIPGIEWDLLLVKSYLSAISPARYDSVLNMQIRVYGQRPERGKE